MRDALTKAGGEHTHRLDSQNANVCRRKLAFCGSMPHSIARCSLCIDTAKRWQRRATDRAGDFHDFHMVPPNPKRGRNTASHTAIVTSLARNVLVTAL
jgi:hypothetical protein